MVIINIHLLETYDLNRTLVPFHLLCCHKSAIHLVEKSDLSCILAAAEVMYLGQKYECFLLSDQ